eukprot:3353838-Rhodomonas_salina.2
MTVRVVVTVATPGLMCEIPCFRDNVLACTGPRGDRGVGEKERVDRAQVQEEEEEQGRQGRGEERVVKRGRRSRRRRRERELVMNTT